MFRYSIIVFILFLFSSNNTFAQSEVGLNFMPIMQSAKTNPAWVGEKKFQIGLPNLHLNYYNTGGVFNELVLDYIKGKDQIDLGNSLEELEEKGNILRGGVEIETFNIGYNTGKFRIGLSHAQRTDLYLDYPKTLAKLFFEGNGQYVGQTIELNHDINLIAYNEFALSASAQLNKLTIGGRIKYLTGIANASLSNNDVALLTDDDIYQLQLTTDYQVNTSTLINSDDLSTFELKVGQFDTDNLLTKNTGLAFDLGLKYNVSDKLMIAASVLDIGEIKWSENVNNYSSNSVATYNGFDFDDITNGGSISFDNALDTLKEVFDIAETQNEYSTTLPTKVYLSAAYDMNEKLQLGGLIFAEMYRGEIFTVVGLSGRTKISKAISVGGVYSIRQDSFFNLGLNFVANLGPVQLFGTTDNVIAVFSPYKNSNVNLRTGLNLLF